MQSFMTEERNNLSAHILSTHKYANHYVHISLINPQNSIPAAAFVVIVRLLMNHSRRFPSRSLIQRQLWSLNGAEFRCQFEYKGNNQIATLMLRVPDVSGSMPETNLKHALEFLATLLYEPAFGDEGKFDERKVQEAIAWAQQHRDYDSSEWDKVVQGRCLEWLGYEDISRLQQLEPTELFADGVEWVQWYRMLIRNPIHIHVVGNVQRDRIANHIWEQFIGWDPDAYTVRFAEQNQTGIDARLPKVQSLAGIQQMTEKQEHPEVQQEVGSMMMERMDIHQCKINVAYSTGIRFGSPLYPALFVFHTLFGATPASRLQIELRERQQRVYQISSQLDDYRETLHITTGTSSAHVAEVLEGIDSEWSRLCDGEISVKELYTTVQNVMHFVQVGFDMPQQIIANHIDFILTGSEMTTAQFLQGIAEVTPESVVSVASGLKKQVTWILYPENEYSA
ncbi:insulinase family protein [Paenibacillus sp. CC-CFT742]|nr:insulinase family protein [Paenibacillus sp. CC-CFT742]WJH31553.1 insulinase family protein [Paenibacillus sp. CC-CFT742]